jgi:hypothetical protein
MALYWRNTAKMIFKSVSDDLLTSGFIVHTLYSALWESLADNFK